MAYSYSIRKPGKHPNPVGSHPMGNNPHPPDIDLEMVDLEIPTRTRGRGRGRTLSHATEPRKPMLPPGIDLTECRQNMVSPYGHDLTVEPLNIPSKTSSQSTGSIYEKSPEMSATAEPISEVLPERPRNALVRAYRRCGQFSHEGCVLFGKCMCCLPSWFVWIVIVVAIIITCAVMVGTSGKYKYVPPAPDAPGAAHRVDVMPHQRLLRFVG